MSSSTDKAQGEVLELMSPFQFTWEFEQQGWEEMDLKDTKAGKVQRELKDTSVNRIH